MRQMIGHHALMMCVHSFRCRSPGHTGPVALTQGLTLIGYVLIGCVLIGIVAVAPETHARGPPAVESRLVVKREG